MSAGGELERGAGSWAGCEPIGHLRGGGGWGSCLILGQKAAVAAGPPPAAPAAARLRQPSEAAGSGRVCPEKVAAGQSAACLCPLAGDLLESPALRVSGSRAAGLYCMRAAALYISPPTSPGSGSSARRAPFLTKASQDFGYCFVPLKSQFNCLDSFNLYIYVHI